MSDTRKTLVLLDVDGTLLWAQGGGRAALDSAVREVFGLADSGDYEPGGHTIRAIVLDILRAGGLPESLFDERRETFDRALTAAFDRLLAAGRFSVQPCPGGLELVTMLARHDEFLPGLLTGNTESIARRKLRAAGYLDEYFVLGAYGDEEADRAVLLGTAIRRAEACSGQHLAGARTVVIGDTPRDIRAAQRAGCRSLAVATGDSSIEALRAAQADAVFPDLSDQQAILRFILN